MSFAEHYAFPTVAKIGRGTIPRSNDFKESFYVRWGSIRFDAFWGSELNLKVVLKVYRHDHVCEQFIVDTDAYDARWNSHKRITRDFYVHPFAMKLGHIKHVAFSFIVHINGRSVPSQHEYLMIDGHDLGDERSRREDEPSNRSVLKGLGRELQPKSGRGDLVEENADVVLIS